MHDTFTPWRPAIVPGYDVLRELGRGGAGVVFLARQQSLGRLVAIKLLRGGTTSDAAERGRFLAEAEALARLRHPNVVQIHEIGEADGQPFLVLEYVAGGSLADRLAGTPLEPAQAAALVETLARTVHSAHQQQIVHRDLKPANILLHDPAGNETTAQPATDDFHATRAWADSTSSPIAVPFELLTPKVSDFGLVKRLDVATVTASGVVAGTPSYMAPEQATGTAVGPAADVYSLGAILYESLTGRPPFVGPTPLDTVMQVLADDPVNPRELQPRVPRDLETICLTCLRKAPARRYPSALALAEDLRRFLDRRPVWARKTGFTERAVKWARRRPASAVGLALGVALAALLAVYSVRLGWKQEEVEREYRRSMAQEQAARDAVAGFYTAVSENQLLREPGMEGLRKELLGKAAGFYQQFVSEQRDSPAARAELARALLRLAALTGELGDPVEGIALGTRARDEFRALLDADPNDARLIADLGSAEERLGGLHRAVGDTSAAEAAYGKAAQVWDRAGRRLPAAECADRLAVVRERRARLFRTAGRGADAAVELAAASALRETHAAEPGQRPRLASLCILAADLHGDRGEDAQAEAQLRRAVKLWAEPAPRTPTPDERVGHAEAWLRLGSLYADTERPNEAVEAMKAAIALLRDLVRDHSAAPGFHHRLAAALNALARVHLAQERGYLAEPLADEARGLLDPITKAHPEVVDYRAELALCRDLLLPWYAESGRWDVAKGDAAAAASAWEELCRRHPDRVDFKLGRAEGRRRLGEACHAAGRGEEAQAAFGEAVRLFDAQPGPAAAYGAARAEHGLALAMIAAGSPGAKPALDSSRARLAKLVTAYPSVTRYRAALADACELAAEHQGAEGVETAREALRQRERLARDFPSVVAFANELARSHSLLGSRLAHAGRYPECLKAHREAVRVRTDLLRTLPETEKRFQSDAMIRREATQALFSVEESCRALGRADDARTAIREALALAEELVAAYPQVPAYRDVLAECHYRLGDLDRQAGLTTDAEADFHRALAIRGPLSGAHPTNRSFAFNHAGDLVGLARVAFRRGRHESAADWASQAIARLEPVLKADPNWVFARAMLRDALRVRGASRALAGHRDDAAADWRRLEADAGAGKVWAAAQGWLAGQGLHGFASVLAAVAELTAE